MAQNSALEIEKNELALKLSEIVKDLSNNVSAHTENDEKNHNLMDENRSYLKQIKLQEIEINKLRNSNDEDFEKNYITEELFLQSLEEKKNEYSKTFLVREEEHFKALSNLNEEIINKNQTFKIKIAQIESSSKLEIIELKNTIEELKSKSNNIESQNELLQDENKLNKKLKSYRVIKSSTASTRGCTYPSCDGKGNIRVSFKTHTSIKNCPNVNSKKPHSKEELKESCNSNKIYLSRQQILHKEEIQSLLKRLNSFEVILIINFCICSCEDIE